MTNTNPSDADSGTPAPIQPGQTARILAPWLKTLNTGEAITRRQAHAMAELMHTANDLTPRDTFLLTALNPAIEAEDVETIAAGSQAGVDMLTATLDQAFNDPRRASPPARTARARKLLDAIQQETEDPMPTAAKAYIEWYEDDTTAAARDATAAGRQDPRITLAAIVIALISHGVRPAWADHPRK